MENIVKENNQKRKEKLDKIYQEKCDEHRRRKDMDDKIINELQNLSSDIEENQKFQKSRIS